MICNGWGKEHASDDIELVFLRPDPVAALPTDIRAAEVQESPLNHRLP